MLETYTNPEAAAYTASGSTSDDATEVLVFHGSLPIYNTTPLVPLSRTTLKTQFPALFTSGSYPSVYVKDESTRFTSTPGVTSSFKILGASLSLHRTLCSYLNVPFSTNYSAISDLILQRRTAATSDPIELVSCTDGNWGRALAKCAGLYARGLRTTIFVPAAVDASVVQRIRDEGAHVTVTQIRGNYDAAIARAREYADAANGFAQSYLDVHMRPLEATRTRAVLLLDTSFAGYSRVPRWVTLGYATCLREVDEQLLALGAGSATHAVCSVGVGSWAHAVVEHYKGPAPSSSLGTASESAVGGYTRPRVKCITVEPTAAPCLLASLHNKRLTSLPATAHTIMEGMNCGTPSDLAWSVLQGGVDVATAVTDDEAHEAVLALENNGTTGSDAKILAGPCGAAPLAALKKLLQEGHLRATNEDVIVLFSTEGQRSYVKSR